MDSHSQEASDFLDENQYTGDNIDHYEIIFGKQFISTGGKETIVRFGNMLHLQSGDRVLDFGSGLGGGACYLASKYNATVLGVDVSKNMIGKANVYLSSADAKVRDNVKYQLCDGTRQEFPAESFSAIISREVIIHVEDKLALFKKFHKWLKPGGKLLISDYCLGLNPNSPDFQYYIKSRKYFMVPLSQYKAALESAGFNDIEMEDLTPTCIEILKHDIQKLAKKKDELLRQLSPQDYENMVKGWKTKLHRSQCGNQAWGLVSVTK